METPTITKPKNVMPTPLMKGSNSRQYQDAWKRFWQVSANLRALWKTKKNSTQVLREGRGL